jgi:hypothetical protein
MAASALLLAMRSVTALIKMGVTTMKTALLRIGGRRQQSRASRRGKVALSTNTEDLLSKYIKNFFCDFNHKAPNGTSVNLNGKLTEGENIADNGGLRVIRTYLKN